MFVNWPVTAVPTGDDSLRMSHLKVGSAADIPLDIGELDFSQLTASITTPSGREEPCLLKLLRNGHVGECVSDASRKGHLLNPGFNTPAPFPQASHLFLRRSESTW